MTLRISFSQIWQRRARGHQTKRIRAYIQTNRKWIIYIIFQIDNSLCFFLNCVFIELNGAQMTSTMNKSLRWSTFWSTHPICIHIFCLVHPELERQKHWSKLFYKLFATIIPMNIFWSVQHRIPPAMKLHSVFWIAVKAIKFSESLQKVWFSKCQKCRIMCWPHQI